MQILVHAQISYKCGDFSKIFKKKTEKLLWNCASKTTWGILKHRFPTVPNSVSNATNPSIQIGMGCWHDVKRVGLLSLMHASVSHTVMSRKWTIIPAFAIRHRLAWHTYNVAVITSLPCLFEETPFASHVNKCCELDLLLPKNTTKTGRIRPHTPTDLLLFYEFTPRRAHSIAAIVWFNFLTPCRLY